MLWRCLWWFANRFKGNSRSASFRHLFPLGTNPSLPQPCLKWHLLGLFHVPPLSPTSLPRHDLSKSAQRFVHHPHGVFFEFTEKKIKMLHFSHHSCSPVTEGLCAMKTQWAVSSFFLHKNLVVSNFPSRDATALFFPWGKMNRCTNEMEKAEWDLSNNSLFH